MPKHPWVVLFFAAVLFFVVVPLRIGFADVDSCQLTISPAVGGTTSPPPGNYSYSYATNVSVTAIPDSGYVFDYWIGSSGNFMGIANITIMMTWNVTLQPVYENATSAKRTLTVLAGNNGTINPPQGTYTYSYGESVTITAIPDPGYILDYWTDGSGHNFGEGQDQLMVTMTWNFTDQPVFAPVPTSVTLTINATVGGTTTPSPGTYTYIYMANVTVTAIPDTGYVFDHWTGDSGTFFGIQNPWELMMNSNFTIQPVFENTTSGTRTLTIWSSVSKGTTSPPPGTYTYNYGENVTVTAIPQNGIYFAGWILDQTSGGMSNPITITMDRSHDLGPNFGPNPPFTVTVTISPATGGTTDPAPGQYPYPSGNQARVTAIPDSGWWLDHWLLDGSNFGNSTTIEFNLDGNHTVSPVFASNTLPASFMLAINAAVGGTTDLKPGSHTYSYGENVTVTASADNGGSFMCWIVDGQNVEENPITVQMTQDHTLQPVFTGSQGSKGSKGSQGGQGGLSLSLNIPPRFILVGAVLIIALCSVGYLAPLGLAMRKGQVPESVKKPRVILALVSILIVAGPLGVTMLVYSGNLSGVLTPSNVNKLTSTFSGQGGITMPDISSSCVNLTSRTFDLMFNFTNPTAADLTIIALSANLTDHNGGYPLGLISLANPVTAGANETIMFDVTSRMTTEAAEHVANAYIGGQSFEVDFSSMNINFAGIMLLMNGTSTVNDALIVR